MPTPSRGKQSSRSTAGRAPTTGRARTRGGSSSSTPPSFSTPPTSLRPFRDFDDDMYRPVMTGLEDPNFVPFHVHHTPMQQLPLHTHLGDDAEVDDDADDDDSDDDGDDDLQGRGPSRDAGRLILPYHGDRLFHPVAKK